MQKLTFNLIFFISILFFASCNRMQTASLFKNQILGPKLSYVPEKGIEAVTGNLMASTELLTDEKTVSKKETAAPAVATDKATSLIPVANDHMNRKFIKKEVKSIVKNAKTSNKQFKAEGGSNLIYLILAFLIPPLAVLLDEGFIGAFWLNILLTLLFVIPGIIHAIIIVLRD